MADIKPVLGLNSSIIKQLDPLINKLPNDPQEIAVIAQSNGENVQRLACCLKLIRIFYDAIPILEVSGKTNPNIDPRNPRFEEELTISKRSSPKSITNIFTCCMISVGPGAIKHYINSPSSPNPFSQCIRIIFRLTWFLRVRKCLLNELRGQNRLGIINNSMRLTSFRDLCYSSMRGALFLAQSNPERVNLRLFAYSVPKRFLTDSVRQMYDDFKSLLTKQRQEELFDLETQVDQILKSKLNPIYFSARTSLEDTILYSFPIGELYENEYEDFLSGYLFEICPDNEMNLFKNDFVKAAKAAAQVKLTGVKKHFDLVHIVNFDEKPKGMPSPSKDDKKNKSQGENKSVASDRGKKTDYSMYDMFKTSHNFIDDTRKFYKNKM